MPIRSKGLRSKTRHVLGKHPRDRGVASPNTVLRRFETGARVAIVLDPAQQKGMTHMRFQGQTGIVQRAQGEAYVIAVRHGDKPKTLVVRPEHLKALA